MIVKAEGGPLSTAADVFRARHGLIDLKRPRWICCVAETDKSVVKQVLEDLEDMICHPHDALVVGTDRPPECIQFSTPEHFLIRYTEKGLTPDRVVALCEGGSCHTRITMHFADLEEDLFPTWSRGRSRFCGRISGDFSNKKFTSRAAWRLYYALVNLSTFSANLKNHGLPYGRPPLQANCLNGCP